MSGILKEMNTYYLIKCDIYNCGTESWHLVTWIKYGSEYVRDHYEFHGGYRMFVDEVAGCERAGPFTGDDIANALKVLHNSNEEHGRSEDNTWVWILKKDSQDEKVGE